MDFRTLPLISGKALLYIAQIIIFFLCLGYMDAVYNNNILPDKLVDDDFTQTTCTVMAKELGTKGRMGHHYRANFLISYTANGSNYQTWVTGNGLDQSYFREREAQEETLSQYDIGGSYPCWYSPQTPQLAVLVLRHDWASTLPLLVPTVIAIISLYYIIKGALQFFGFIKLKAAEKKKRYR
jgi:hypothetical protein